VRTATRSRMHVLGQHLPTHNRQRRAVVAGAAQKHAAPPHIRAHIRVTSSTDLSRALDSARPCKCSAQRYGMSRRRSAQQLVLAARQWQAVTRCTTTNMSIEACSPRPSRTGSSHRGMLERGDHLWLAVVERRPCPLTANTVAARTPRACDNTIDQRDIRSACSKRTSHQRNGAFDARPLQRTQARAQGAQQRLLACTRTWNAEKIPLRECSAARGGAQRHSIGPAGGCCVNACTELQFKDHGERETSLHAIEPRSAAGAVLQ
jgi:hypothetical protein